MVEVFSHVEQALVLWLIDHDDMADQFEPLDLAGEDFLKKNLDVRLCGFIPASSLG